MAVGRSVEDTVIPETPMDRKNNICYPAVMVARHSCIVLVAVREEHRTCKQDGRK